MNLGSTQLSPGMTAVLAVVAAIELVLLVWALVKLVRAPKDRLTLPWYAWLAIILLVSGFGALAFLIAGVRKPTTAPVDTAPRSASATQHAVDVLYGERDR